MKLLFIGNYELNTGPSNVNKDLLLSLPKDTLRLKNKNILLKIIELVHKVSISDVVIISGITYMGYLGLRLVKLFNKKSLYIMHGSIRFESKINNQKNPNGIKLENQYLDMTDKVLCVSERYLSWFNSYYNKYKHKSDYLNNGINWSVFDRYKKNDAKDKDMIITMGGGRPQKNNLVLAKAIEHLNKTYDTCFKLYVLGRDYSEAEKIKEIPCVQYIGQVKQDEAIKLLSKAKIFVQNSTLESFGLAPIEALIFGCDILVSQNVGSISIMKTEDTDVIVNYDNIEEIASKIFKLSKIGNNQRLLSGIDKENTSCEYAADRLVNIAKKLFEENSYD